MASQSSTLLNYENKHTRFSYPQQSVKPLAVLPHHREMDQSKETSNCSADCCTQFWVVFASTHTNSDHDAQNHAQYEEEDHSVLLQLEADDHGVFFGVRGIVEAVRERSSDRRLQICQRACEGCGEDFVPHEIWEDHFAERCCCLHGVVGGHFKK